MKVKILAFGILKERLGAAAFEAELAEGATVKDLLAGLKAGGPFRGIAVSVNQQYARAADELHEGDEVGLLPPVSGGTDSIADSKPENEPPAEPLPYNPFEDPMFLSLTAGRVPLIVVELTRKRIDVASVVEQGKDEEDGAVVVFEGIVRNNSRGRRTLHLDYEAYERMAVAKLNALAKEARKRFGARYVAIVHRLGRVAIGETSVLIVVTSAHRAAAYAASQWLIDTLKTTAPVWKKETFDDGAVWADGEPFPESIAIPLSEQKHVS
jgi:MoaE-MoaD fusion protein